MLTLSLNTLPRESALITEQLREIRGRPAPPFTRHQPDYQLLYSLAGKYAGIANFVVIGNNSGVLGFKALYTALAKYKTTKRVSVLEAPDPDYVAHIKRKFRQDDTLVIAVSERGDDPFVIQELLAFAEYKKLVITGEGPLRQYASSKELDLVNYPEVAEPYCAGTEAALLPGAIIYVDVKSLVNGMQSVYKQCDPSRPLEQNPALQLAVALLAAKRRGRVVVHVPVLSKALAGSFQLLGALMAGLDQTFIFSEGATPLHDQAALFLRVERPENEVVVAAEYQVSGAVAKYAGAKLGDAAAKLYDDARRAADEAGVPNGTITLDVLNPGTLGELLGFWQYVALYSKWLRGQE